MILAWLFFQQPEELLDFFLNIPLVLNSILTSEIMKILASFIF